MRPPDFIVRGPGGDYLHRWYVIPRNRWFNVYYHRFLHSDEDRALHDHMYVNASIILRGSYIEHFADGTTRLRRPGNVVLRRPTTAHRVELINGAPVVTLFVTGPRVRNWGFLCPGGWVPHEVFLDKKGCP
jgi:hypothetical protein